MHKQSAVIAELVDTYEDLKAQFLGDFPTRGPILQGHPAIENYWTPNPAGQSRTIYHRIWPSEIQILGNTAYDYGYYEGKTQLSDGRQSHWRGKYVIVWHRTQAGDWKMYLDIWNRL